MTESLGRSGGNPAVYYSHKSFYATKMQAGCDSAGRFLDLYLPRLGSTHDSTAWGVALRSRPLGDGELAKRFFIACDEA
jgi:hypothetical protein